jgi:hypothetical protein
MELILTDKSRVVTVSNNRRRRFTLLITLCFHLRNVTLLGDQPACFFKLIMLCSLRGGKLIILRPGVLSTLDMNARINRSLGWWLEFLARALGLVVLIGSGLRD